VKSEEDALGKRVGRIGILEGVERRERISVKTINLPLGGLLASDWMHK